MQDRIKCTSSVDPDVEYSISLVLSASRCRFPWKGAESRNIALSNEVQVPVVSSSGKARREKNLHPPEVDWRDIQAMHCGKEGCLGRWD